MAHNEAEYALQTLSSFALSASPICRSDVSTSTLEACAAGGECEGVQEELMQFPNMYAYLQTIAEITGAEPFSYEVAEAYWLGNDLLDKFGLEHFEILLAHMRELRLPAMVIDSLEKNPPQDFVPFHLFQVLLAQGDQINLEITNQCMVRWGQVVEIGDGGVTVKLNSVVKVDGEYRITERDSELPRDLKLVPGIKAGDVAAVHLGLITKVLSTAEAQNLSLWTGKVLALWSAGA